MSLEEERRPLRPAIQGDKSSLDMSDDKLMSQQEPDMQAQQKKKRIKYILIGVAVVVVLTLAIVLPIVLTKSSSPDNPPTPPPPPPPPTPPLSNETVYNPYNSTGMRDTQTTFEGFLYAHGGYQAEKHLQAYQHLTQFLATNATPHNFTTLPKQFPIGQNNMFIRNLSFQFFMSDYHVAELILTDATKERYSIPEEVVNKPKVDPKMKLEMIGLKVFPEPFAFQFEDIRDQNNVYLHTNQSTLVFLDKFIQMDFQLPSQRVFGFGERTRQFNLGEGTWTMWASGKNNIYDDGYGGKNSYGVHPFILVQSKTKGDYFGMYFRNSNAQSPILRFNETTGGSTLSYITTGGQIEIVFFLHGSPKYIIQQYQYVIGTPNLPPIWSMGWHQASYAYNTQDDIENMMDKYSEQQLPLDVVWLDISYMEKFQDFTVNKTAYPNLKGLADTLHENYQYIVPILDAGLSADDKFNPYYQLATTKDATIKTTINKGNGYSDNLISKVWPEKTAFMDWFSVNAQEVWGKGLKDLQDQFPYDGLWLDMNEATTFVNGELSKDDVKTVQEPQQSKDTDEQSSFQRFLREEMQPMTASNDTNFTDPRTAWYKTFTNQTSNSTYFLPFIPGYWYSGNLDNMSLSLNASHPSNGLTEYDLHSLYGHSMAEHTYVYMTHNPEARSFGYRPFILTRSTFVGSGRFASHWTGDNWRDWSYLNYSIAAIMNFNMFGIPHTGSDVCGFFGKGTLDQELCARWIQLATFYPFARNHYANDSTPSEPYRLQGEWLSTARTAMHDRYQYIRMVYTCLFEASQWGTTCFDPLFYHYPDDDNVYQFYEHTFIVGNAIKVSPILEKGQKDFRSYFPKGNWASLVEEGVTVQSNGGEVKTLKAKPSVQAHLKPGAIIPFQSNVDQTIKKIHDLRERPITLMINRDQDFIAKGSVLLDSGVSFLETRTRQGQYEYYTITYQEKTIQKKLSAGTHGTQKQNIDKIVIFNAADLSDTSFACYYTPALDIVNITAQYDSTLKSLTLVFRDPIPYNQWRQINFGSATQKDLNLCSPNTYQYWIKDGKLPDLTGNSTTFEAVNLGGVAANLKFSMKVINANTVNVKWTISKPNYTPYEVPDNLINITQSQTLASLSQFVQVMDKPLRIMIRDTQKRVVSTISEFLLDDYLNYYYQQVNAEGGDNFKGIMGLGERVQNDLFYADGVYSLWNRDAATPFDDGKPPGNNVYGTHPFFMYKNTKGSWVGVFTKLAAAQDWYIKNDKPTGKVNVTLVAAGGLGDVYYIIDSTPSGVSAAYLELVGRPALIPQWALGWHQCRWGYNDTNALKYVVGNYTRYDLPLDAQWTDIDYMHAYRDFTTNNMYFLNLSDFVHDLHAMNKHYVPIIDAGIAMRQKGRYVAYDLGVEDDVFIKVNGETLVGQVWPNDAAYPDWFNPKTTKWWQNELTYFWGHINFDGLWEDMNEASNFCSGYCYDDQRVNKPLQYQTRYTPTGRYLEQLSIPLDGTHYNDVKEIDAHNLFGISEVKTTHEWFQKNKMRTFIISRSSFAGHGKFGQKWGGDNFSDRFHMGYSVVAQMMMGIFGIPFYGSDICGFIGTTNAELCARWYVVGAFYTFSRNHNDYNSLPQEPYVWAKEDYVKGITYTDIIRIAMRTKYCLLRYYYTHMFMLHKNGGGPFYKPLFFEFPDDPKTFSDFENNVMLGASLKLSVLANDLGVNSTNFYFPEGTWCSIFDPNEKCFNSTGMSQSRRTFAYDYYVHLRDGHIIPAQDAFRTNANTTYALQFQPVDFHINPKKTPWAPAFWSANGVYINDDGESLNITGNYNEYTLVAQQGKNQQTGGTEITIQVQTTVATNYKPQNVTSLCYSINKADFLGEIVIYNANASSSSGRYAVVVFFTNGKEWEKILTAKYESATDQLKVNFNGELCLSAVSYIKMTKF